MNAAGMMAGAIPFRADPVVRQERQRAEPCPLCGRPAHLAPPLWDAMAAIACNSFGVSLDRIASSKVTDRLTTARAFLVWSQRSLGKPMGYSEIGRRLGGRDHSTIINLHLKAIYLRVVDPAFAAACASLSHNFYIIRENCHGSH